MLANNLSNNQVHHVIITDANAGQRIDNFLLTLLRGLPKSRLYRIIRKGEVRVNKRRIEVSYRLVCGDQVRIPPLRLSEKSSPAPGVQFTKLIENSISYEDEKLIVVNKPTGLAVHGGSGVSLGLIEALRATRPGEFLELVHRIDRDTSGCIMIAKHRSLLIHLHEHLKTGKIQKRYQALVQGQWRGGKIIEAPLLKYVLRSGERMVKVDPNGKSAQTRIKVLRTYENATLVEASPVTGRTHQIRVHCAFMGHPIIGDQKYGKPECNHQAKIKGLDRLFLHAHQLTVQLPYKSSVITITCPLPEACEAYLGAMQG